MPPPSSVAVGDDVRVRSTGSVGKVTAENGHACKVYGCWLDNNDVEVIPLKSELAVKDSLRGSSVEIGAIQDTHKSRSVHNFKPDLAAIQVRNLSGDLLAEVDANDTIYKIKAKIRNEKGIPPDEELQLLFGEEVLKDGDTLSGYNLGTGSTIVCVKSKVKTVKVSVDKAYFGDTDLPDISFKLRVKSTWSMRDLDLFVDTKVRAQVQQDRLDSILTANANLEVEIAMPEEPALNGQIAIVVESVGPSEWKVRLVRATCKEGEAVDADWLVFGEPEERKIKTKNLRLTQHAQDKLNPGFSLREIFFPFSRGGVFAPREVEYNIHLHLMCLPGCTTNSLLGDLHEKYHSEGVLHLSYFREMTLD